MHISNLCLEVTRNCNLRCAHCLRGNPQRVKMSREIVHNVFSYVDSVGTLTFTGGEPSLAVDVIENIVDVIRWRRISFSYFYCVSNAKTRNGYRKFLTLLNQLYEMSDEKDCCALEVSQDQYHRALHDIDFSKFEIRDEYGSYGEYYPFFNKKARTHDYEPISEGRAKETQVGSTEPHQQKPWECSEYRGELHVNEEEVYIAANGNVVSCCNMSFRRMDKEAKGNILTKPLTQIIESYCEMEKEEPETVAV